MTLYADAADRDVLLDALLPQVVQVELRDELELV